MIKKLAFVFFMFRLIVFSYPGIGSSEVHIRPKNAVALDKNFKYMLSMYTTCYLFHYQLPKD